MSMVPDITAGTGTESDETPGWWWPVGLSQSEGAHEMAVSVDGALFRVPGHLGVGRPSIYTTALLAGNPSQLPRWRLPGRFGGANRGGAVSRPGAHENRSPACATRGGANSGEVRPLRRFNIAITVRYTRKGAVGSVSSVFTTEFTSVHSRLSFTTVVHNRLFTTACSQPPVTTACSQPPVTTALPPAVLRARIPAMRRRDLFRAAIALSLAGECAVLGQGPADASPESRKAFLGKFPWTEMCTTPEDAMMLRILIESRGAKRGVEVGGNVGYGAINMGIGFERTAGHLYSLEIDPGNVRTARKNLGTVGLDKTVTVVEGDALKVLTTLEAGIDFVFIDALKPDYLKYFRSLEPKLVRGTTVVADNVIVSARQM